MCTNVYWLLFILMVSFVGCENACEIYFEISPDRMITLVNQDEMCSCFKYKKSEDASSLTGTKSCAIEMMKLKGKMAFSADSLCGCAGFEVHAIHKPADDSLARKHTDSTAINTTEIMARIENKTSIHNDSLKETTTEHKSVIIESDDLAKTLNTKSTFTDITNTDKLEVKARHENSSKEREISYETMFYYIPSTTPLHKSSEKFATTSMKADATEKTVPKSHIIETKTYDVANVTEKLEIIDGHEHDFVTRYNSSVTALHETPSTKSAEKLIEEVTTKAIIENVTVKIFPKTHFSDISDSYNVTNITKIITEYKNISVVSDPVTRAKLTDTESGYASDTESSTLLGYTKADRSGTVPHKYETTSSSIEHKELVKNNTYTNISDSKIFTIITSTPTFTNDRKEKIINVSITNEHEISNSSSLIITDAPHEDVTTKNDYLIVATFDKYPINKTVSKTTTSIDEKETGDDFLITASDTTIEESIGAKERSLRSPYTTERYDNATSTSIVTESGIYMNHADHTDDPHTTPSINLTDSTVETNIDDEYYNYKEYVDDDSSSTLPPVLSVSTLATGENVTNDDNLIDISHIAVYSESLTNIALLIVLCIFIIIVVAIIVKIVKCCVNRGSYVVSHQEERNIEMDTKT